MSESPLKEMASHRELKAGHFIFEFDTPGIGYILKHAGCDFTILDTEHSGFGIETVRRVMAVMEGRVPNGIVNRDVVDRPGWKERLAGYAREFGGG